VSGVLIQVKKKHVTVYEKLKKIAPIYQIYFRMIFYMFRAVFPSIIRGSRLYTATGICQTVNPAMGKIFKELHSKII